MREKWLKAILFADWTPPKNGKLCDLHFSPGDSLLERRDSDTPRHNARGGTWSVEVGCASHLTQCIWQLHAQEFLDQLFTGDAPGMHRRIIC